MATFARTSVIKSSRLLSWSVLRQCRKAQPVCFISTSKKKKDGLVANVDPLLEKSEELKKLEKHFADQDPKSEKNRIVFGFDYGDPEMDRFAKNVVFFFMIVCFMGWGSFFVAYFPDYRLKHWARREAHLELERREKLGMPVIDPWYISPEKMEEQLPSDEELGDTEIII